MTSLKTTPLTAWHRDNGAKMAPFAGYDMPVQYESILAEHQWTRNHAGLFDISHMGEFVIEGPGAKDGLNALVTHDLDTLAPGKCRYGFLLNESGGVLDDLIVYCLGEDQYMLVVNAACEDKDFQWISGRMGGLPVVNVSPLTAKIDLQGPESLDVLETVLGSSWRHLKYFNHETTSFFDSPLRVSRTGYTGELGYELYLPAQNAVALWEALVADERVKPVGLGARDTLRLECGLPLYGQDLDEEHTPREAGYGFLLKKETPYVGRDGLEDVREKLVPLAVEGRRTPRHGDTVLGPGGDKVGDVTSGSFAPSLGHCVALAWVSAADADAETFRIQGARAQLDARRVSLPFYTEGTARMKLE